MTYKLGYDLHSLTFWTYIWVGAYTRCSAGLRGLQTYRTYSQTLREFGPTCRRRCESDTHLGETHWLSHPCSVVRLILSRTIAHAARTLGWGHTIRDWVTLFGLGATLFGALFFVQSRTLRVLVSHVHVRCEIGMGDTHSFILLILHPFGMGDN